MTGETLLALDPATAEARIVELGGRTFHARSARRQLLTRGTLEYAAMTDLPAALRTRLEDELPLLAGREATRSTSADGTTKLLIEFDDGAGVEAVHMPSRRAGRGATLCVSTQVGCAVACPFCASGLDGLRRNLAAHEIVEQVVRGVAIAPLARIVVMGIGEPLLNWENLTAALDVVRDDVGLGARKITVSTVGFPERLRRAAREHPRFQLAISLHSPDDDQRAELVPAMRDVPVADLLAAGDDWFEVTGREITYEYVLLGGENDTPAHAARLGRRLSGRRASVNLIPYNPIPGDRYARPDAERVEAFRAALEAAGVVATVRWSRGVAADAACGQLRRRTGAPR